ncbi:hypothetical protein CR513_39024, partial [Mucuna pruriens]
MEKGRIRRGYVPVLVGEREEDMQKIWVTIKAIHHLTIVELLDQSSNECGHHKGLLKIKYDANKFKALLRNISKNQARLYLDESCNMYNSGLDEARQFY